jgi:hypothetical protein
MPVLEHWPLDAVEHAWTRPGYGDAMADPNKIPYDVRITVCADCGAYGTTLEACREQRHHLSMVHYEIAALQNDSVAMRRVADLQHHGRRLIQER